jgi:hypothetical protein
MSLDMLASGYKRKLQNQAALWKDVSGMAWVYYQIVNESNRIKKKIWIDTWTPDTEPTPQTTNFYKQYANTAPWVWKKRPYWSNNQWNVQLSNWQSFNWNS